jgi:hypothetical protein
LKISERDYLQFSRETTSGSLFINSCNQKFSSLTGVNDAGKKFFIGVVDTARKLFTSASETGLNQSKLAQHLSAVSVTQVTLLKKVNNFPVTSQTLSNLIIPGQGEFG